MARARYSNYDDGSSSGRFHGAEGECFFKIKEAVEGHSLNRNPQTIIKLQVRDKNGDEGIVTDYFPHTKNSAWKMNKLLKAIKKPEWNRPEGFDIEDLVGLNGRGMLEDSVYETPTKTFVSSKMGDYLDPNAVEVPATKVVTKKLEDDLEDLPF